MRKPKARYFDACEIKVLPLNNSSMSMLSTFLSGRVQYRLIARDPRFLRDFGLLKFQTAPIPPHNELELVDTGEHAAAVSPGQSPNAAPAPPVWAPQQA